VKTNSFKSGFTLLELLTVIAIIGVLAAIAVPTMNTFKPNVSAAAASQLLADISRARQLANQPAYYRLHGLCATRFLSGCRVSITFRS
jgi:prepilin-type N-terminal cleavage/methylation domain-containing protein